MTETNAERIARIKSVAEAGLPLLRHDVRWLIQQAEIVAGANPVVECFSEKHKAWRECARPDSCTNKKRHHYDAPQPACGNENQGEKK